MKDEVVEYHIRRIEERGGGNLDGIFEELR